MKRKPPCLCLSCYQMTEHLVVTLIYQLDITLPQFHWNFLSVCLCRSPLPHYCSLSLFCCSVFPSLLHLLCLMEFPLLLFLTKGVPQGSILGLLQLLTYMLSMSYIFTKDNIHYYIIIAMLMNSNRMPHPEPLINVALFEQ